MPNHIIILTEPPRVDLEAFPPKGTHIRPAQQSAAAKREQARAALAARARPRKSKVTEDQRRDIARRAAVLRWGKGNV